MHNFYFDAAGDPGLKRFEELKRNKTASPFYVQCIVFTEFEPVVSQRLKELRQEFGLPVNYEFKFVKRLRIEQKQKFYAEMLKTPFQANVKVVDKQKFLVRERFGLLTFNEFTIGLIQDALMESLEGIRTFKVFIDGSYDSRQNYGRL